MTALSAFSLPPISSAAFLESAARHAAGAVVSGTWEGLLLAAATAVLLRVVPGTSARLRFAVWTTVFFVLALLPFLNATLMTSGRASAAATAPFRVDPRWSYMLAGLWIAAVVLRLGTLAAQAARLRGLWRLATPVPSEALAALELRLERVQVCTSAAIDRPCLIGFSAPRILIPEWLFGQLTDAELYQIVLHEMEHLRRRDDWVNLLQKLGLALFPLNPALAWIDRRMATERELACDDGVLSRTRAPRAYATCLTSLAERQIARRRRGPITALALGALGAIRRSEFSRRIESILSRRPGLSPAAGRVYAILFIAAVLAAGGGLAHAPELVAFGSGATLSAQAIAQPAIASAAMARNGAVEQKTRAAHMEEVVFNPRSETVRTKPEAVKAKPAEVLQMAGRLPKTRPVKVLSLPLEQADAVIDPVPQFKQATQRQEMEQQRRLLLMTSWQEKAPVPVIVTLPDGRTFFATYTATPTQAGWILFQL